MTQICETTGRDGLRMICRDILFWLEHAYMIFFFSELAMHQHFLFAWEAAGYFFLNLPTSIPLKSQMVRPLLY